MRSAEKVYQAKLHCNEFCPAKKFLAHFVLLHISDNPNQNWVHSSAEEIQFEARVRKNIKHARKFHAENLMLQKRSTNLKIPHNLHNFPVGRWGGGGCFVLHKKKRKKTRCNI